MLLVLWCFFAKNGFYALLCGRKCEKSGGFLRFLSGFCGGGAVFSANFDVGWGIGWRVVRGGWVPCFF